MLAYVVVPPGQTLVTDFIPAARAVLLGLGFHVEHEFGVEGFEYLLDAIDPIDPTQRGYVAYDDMNIEAAWKALHASYVVKRAEQVSGYEADYIAETLTPAYDYEDAVFALPAAVILAAHEAGREAFVNTFSEEPDCFYHSDYPANLCEDAQRNAREAVRDVITEALKGDD